MHVSSALNLELIMFTADSSIDGLVQDCGISIANALEIPVLNWAILMGADSCFISPLN